jgi:hypothetical protein
MKEIKLLNIIKIKKYNIIFILLIKNDYLRINNF